MPTCTSLLRAGALAALLPLAACSTIRPPIAPELVWQAVNAVDMGQTVTIARRPADFTEHGFPTHYLIGEHPGEGAVERFAVASAVLHYAVSTWLDREADANGGEWRWARNAWYALTIGYSAFNVAHNTALGISLFGARRTAVARSWPPTCTEPVSYTPCLDGAP